MVDIDGQDCESIIRDFSKAGTISDKTAAYYIYIPDRQMKQYLNCLKARGKWMIAV